VVTALSAEARKNLYSNTCIPRVVVTISLPGKRTRPRSAALPPVTARRKAFR